MISLGVDIGGTGAKCVAFRDDGAQLALSYCEYPNPPGKVNLDAEVLAESALRVIRECAEALPDKGEVAAVTVSSFGESFVPVDEDGRPLTDVIMYFADSSSKEFDAVVNRVGAERFMEIARVKPDASYSLAKMLYTCSLPGVKAWKFLLIAGFICYRLSGVAATDVSLACRTLLYDVERRHWSEELLRAAGLRADMMPDVYETGSVIGELKPDVAAELGLPAGVKVVIGAHDQIVNALACGVREPGDAMDGTGTTECIEPLFADIPRNMEFISENYACVPYVDGRGYVTYAYNLSGGAVVRWYRDQLAKHLRDRAKAEGVSIYDILNRECPSEPGELMVLPYLQGLGGTPDIRVNARGVLWGVSMDTDLPQIYRAILEGLSFEMAYNLEKLEYYGIGPKRLYACGGGAKSKVWLQVKADVWNREILPVETEETGALGSAILGFAAVTGERDRCALARKYLRIGEPVRPIPEHVEIYRGKFREFKRLRALLLDFQKSKEE